MAWTERYVSVAGGGAHDGTTEADAWTLAEAIAAPYAAGQRINVKAGTYANTTTDRNFTVDGTATAPIWWRGYKTTIGDMDARPTSTRTAGTDIPSFTFTTGRMVVGGDHQTFTNIDVVGSLANNLGQVSVTGASEVVFHRCRMETTNTESSSRYCFRNDTSPGTVFSECWLKGPAGADYVVVLSCNTSLIGCVFHGSNAWQVVFGDNGEPIVAVVEDCVFDDPAGGGLYYDETRTGSMLIVRGNTFYSSGSDGIRINGVPPAGGVITRNIIDSCGGYGINNSSGTNTAKIIRVANDFRNNSSGSESGFGDTPSIAEQTESSIPFTNAGGHDFTIVSGANAKANGGPGLFENETYSGYLDIGAVQRQESSGGSSVFINRKIVR